MADDLRSVVEELAVLSRLPTSPGERQAAELICSRLAGYGCRARVETVAAYRSYAWPIGVLSTVGVVSALVGMRGHRVLGALGGTAAALAIVDDITGGPLVCRQWTMRSAEAANVV